MRGATLATAFLALLAALPAPGRGADPGPLTLGEALKRAEDASPALRAGVQRETESGDLAQEAAAFYFPHVEAAAATGAGLAGSPGEAPAGVAGVLASPFRAGPRVGADIAASWDILDVSQTLAHLAARGDERSQREETRILRVQVDQEALLQYFDAARAQGQAALWRSEAARVQSVYREVERYEQVGRYSEVQLLLLKEMLDEALLSVALSDEQARYGLRRLAVTLGTPDQSPAVPGAADVSEADLDAIEPGTLNPLLGAAQEGVKTAQDRERSALALGLPTVFANASLGTVDKTLLVPEADYSASIGVALPVFEGFRNASEYGRARAQEREEAALLEDTQRRITQAEDGYDDAVALARVRLASAQDRDGAAVRNLKLSQERYLRLTGPLTDLQQALVNLTEIELELNNSRADLLSALGARKLFDGGAPR